ncbi:NUDIX hydrolase [Buttiauxella noackiae]|jgi:ADP-ribose pyrophosphatase YjhB (NUDIX family)|uniref:NUDIX hydrolase n=1 Tax=Buttiauxella noackiae TaxID=82992 RepID=UPI0023533825|nr:NUDIX domain-containing protein [Buttiauxella noackiae]MCA1922170.1 NUDIX domain-containing protein [Buttiauxella noackiae]
MNTRTRPSSRLLILNNSGAVLLFRFSHRDDALEGKVYWATPGGGLESGESFEQAAIRELHEETGLVRLECGPCVAQRTFTMQLPSGETVKADERFYVINASENELSQAGWSENEKRVISQQKWWTQSELLETDEVIFPEGLTTILEDLVDDEKSES